MRFRTPELFLGALLAIAIFAVGMLFASSPPLQPQNNNQTTASQQSPQEKKPKNHESAQSLWVPIDSVGLYTLVLAVFTGLLAIVAGVQGFFMLRADKTARIAATAAKESADVARDSLIYTQRAYVRVASFPWLWRLDLSRPDKYLYDITPMIENGGNTQTVDMKININFALRDEPLPPGFDFPFQHEAGSTLIGAHQAVGASNVVILDEELLAVGKGEKFFYIWGSMTYRDVFPDTPEHTTEFCTQISRVMGDALDPHEPGNPRGTTVEIGFRIYPEHTKTN